MSIRDCAVLYQEYKSKTCRLTLENGLVLEFRFLLRHFKHLLGLEKLADIRNIRTTRAEHVFKRILDEDSFCSAIHRSQYFSQIESRVRYFPLLDELLHSKIIIDFDPSRVPNGTMLRNTDYILYTRRDGGYVNLTISSGLDGFFPETFFFEPTKKYITGQELLDVVSVELIDHGRK